MNTKITPLLTTLLLLSYQSKAQTLLEVGLTMRSLTWLIPMFTFLLFATWIIFYGNKMANEFKVLEQEEDNALMNHNYDGIEELDNDLPTWWLYGFYLTIFFSIFYMVDYHVLKSSPLSIDEYQEVMAIAEEAAKNNVVIINEDDMMVSEDDKSLASGKQVFDTNCLACHGPDGGGTVGPNLTDQYWIHGGSFSAIYKTIQDGVPEKGMIAWSALLNPTQIQDVTSYIMTLEEVPGKAAEGELYSE